MMARWILLCLAIFPNIVMADSALTFTPPGTDYSVIFLGNLFGVVDGVLHGTGSQIMGAMFGVFNAAVLALGGIVVVYTIIVGTMNTAHEGQMLGQKWSSIWIPVRSTIGLAFLVPKASGYCLMQIFIMWVVVQGVGAADKIWNAALEYLNRGGAIVKAQNSANSTTAEGTPEGSLSLGDSSSHGTSYNNALINMATGAGSMLQGLVCMKGVQTLLENQRTTLLKDAEKGTGSCSDQSLAAANADPFMVYFCKNPVPDFISTVNAIDTVMGPESGFVSACDPKYTDDGKTGSAYAVPMPNFTNNEYYVQLNKVCGVLSWNDFNVKMTSVPSLTCSDKDMTRQSRAIAVQQVYSDLTPVASAIIDNDPQINTSITTTTNQYSTVALNQFGLPYLSSGGVCTSPSSSCSNWSPDKSVSNQSLILSGFELQNSLADYNGIMLAALNLQQQIKDGDQNNSLRSFIQTSEQQGWIMAGAYFFDLAYLNGLVTSNSGLIDRDSGLEGTTVPLDKMSTNSTLIMLLGSPVPLQNLKSLIDGSNVDNVATEYIFNVTTSASAATDNKRSSTVNGYVTDAAMVHLPGQPGLDTPSFSMNFNIKPGQTSSAFPKKHYGGIWGWFKDFIYNGFFRGIVNYFVGFVVGLFNAILQAFLYIPLTALMLTFDSGIQLLETTMIHPIIALAYMGAGFVNESVDIWVNLLVSGTVYGLMTFGIAWGIILMILPFISSWLGIMTSIGYIDAYYVPFFPYMMFTFGSIAWLMAVIEAMVAGPIVALGVTHPEGHDALGKAEQAVMILVNVFLRPSMMIIGYMSSIALSYVSVFILNTGFVRIMQFLLPSAGNAATAITDFANTGSGQGMSAGSPYYNWSAIYASFFCLVTYTSIYVTVVQKSFTLIYILPDKILRWMGSQGEGIGQETAQWGDEAKGQTKDAGEATGKSSMKTGGTVMGLAESAAVGANKGTSGGSATGGSGSN